MNDGTALDISGDKIFIGVGARTNIPDLPGLEETGYLTSETLFGSKYPETALRQPAHHRRRSYRLRIRPRVQRAAGTKVTIVQRNVRLLPKEDEDISAFYFEAAHQPRYFRPPQSDDPFRLSQGWQSA